MKLTTHGAGYVGLVTGACLAEVGNHVLCLDVDEAKVNALRNGQIPIYEPGLEEMVQRNFAAGRLNFTTDIQGAVEHGLVQFIAVGTPPDEDGSADLQYVLAAAKNIGRYMLGHKVVVDKSTVPLGTADRVKQAIGATLADRNSDLSFDVVSNPEFLKEGAAVGDFMKPDRIIIGTDSERAAKLLRQIYEPFSRNHDKLIQMDIRSAELTKYAANGILATKISFMNELANLAERYGADIEKVRVGIGSDSRIGHSFIYPGCGYGGSCLPKDVSALAQSAGEIGYQAELIQAVENVNNRQKKLLAEKILRHFNGDLVGRRFAVWGLAFKPNTNDMRAAPSRDLMEAIWAAGGAVSAYDPQAREEAGRLYGQRSDLTLCESAEAALDGADALVIVTEWQEFRSPDFDRIKNSLSEPVIFDGRNVYNPETLAELGISYYGIGRGLTIG